MNCSATRSPSSRAVSASCWICPVTRFSWSSASCTGATTSAKDDLRRLDGGDDDPLVRVQEVLHHHHRVVPLLDRLAVEVGGELGKRLRVVVDGDRDVLLRRAELVRDLLVECVREARHAARLYTAAPHAPSRVIGEPGRRPTAASPLPVLTSSLRRALVLAVRVRRSTSAGAEPSWIRRGFASSGFGTRISRTPFTYDGGDLRLVDAGRQPDGTREAAVTALEAEEAVALLLRRLARSPETVRVSSVHLDRDLVLGEAGKVEGVDELGFGLPDVEARNPGLRTAAATLEQPVEEPAHLALDLGELAERLPADECRHVMTSCSQEF